MSALDKVAEIGTEHGQAAGEAWLTHDWVG